MCVQRFDDSRSSAIHITYRISLRSSSLREPRDPLLIVVLGYLFNKVLKNKNKIKYRLFKKNPLATSANKFAKSQHKALDYQSPNYN
jgi:hypothetical protein